MITLGPNTYKPNAKFALLSENIIDTVVTKPISNVTTEEKVVHTEDVTTVDIKGETYNLPLQDDVVPTYYRAINNVRWSGIIYGDDELAKARVDCVIATGKTLCTLDEPITGTPTVNVRLQGTSSIIDRGGSTYDNYPSLSTLNNNAWSLSGWIEQNKSTTVTNLTRDYTGTTFSMNPWIRNVVTTDSGSNPTPNDVLTEWMPPNDGFNETYVWWQNWVEKSNFTSGTYPSIRMYSPNGLNYDLEYKAGTTLFMQNVNLSITCSVAKIDDYNYEVTWSVPVRYAYAAASRARKAIGGMLEVDNYAFVDKITNIIIELSAIPLNTSSQEITYSLLNGELSTSQPAGNHVLSIDAGEMLTLGTRKKSSVWTEQLAYDLLQKYQKGIYIFECDVPANWVIKNKVDINTPVIIRLLDGSYIQRDNICVFHLKNIVKKYNNFEFIYTLKFVEV